MRFAFVLHKYFAASGLARDMLRIAAAASARGHNISVLTQEWEGDRPEGVAVTTVPVHGYSNHGRARSFHHSVTRELRSNDFDLVVGFNKLPGLDVYFAADECFAAKVFEQRPVWYRWTPRCRQWLAFERAVFAPSARTRVLLLSPDKQADFRAYHLTPDNRFHLLPPNLDAGFPTRPLDRNTRRRVRAGLEISDGDVFLLAVGSGFSTKGFDRALHAFAALPRADQAQSHLLIAGRGDAAPLEELASSLGIAGRVRFLGERSDIANLMRAADLLLHPARREAAGAVLLEALVSGLPILTTSVCGHATHVARARAGIVLPEPYRQIDMNRALAKALRSDRAGWKRAARRYAKANPLTGLAEHTVDLLENFARTPAPAGARAETGKSMYICDPLRQAWDQSVDFEEVMNLQGEVFRTVAGRRTVRFVASKQAYFLKSHSGVGWPEIIKNLLYLRAPVLGAANEWHALHRLPKLGVAVAGAAGYGCSGLNPARRRSFVIAREIGDAVSLETVAREWRTLAAQPGMALLKRRLISVLAQIARQLHDAGLNHRDFYLCHFLMRWPGFPRRAPSGPPELYLIDLHRVQQRRRTPSRWRIKDLAGLLFSAADAAPTLRDQLRFVRQYRARPLKVIMRDERDLWERVVKRAEALQKKMQRKAAGPDTSSKPSSPDVSAS